MNGSGPKSRVGGDPVYASARGIAVDEGALPFEDAHALAVLVITERGGPGKIGGKTGMTKARAKRLQKLGFVAICGQGTHDEGLTLTFRDKPTGIFGDEPGIAIASVQRVLSVDLKEWVMATQEGVDLVERHQLEA